MKLIFVLASTLLLVASPSVAETPSLTEITELPFQLVIDLLDVVRQLVVNLVNALVDALGAIINAILGLINSLFLPLIRRSIARTISIMVNQIDTAIQTSELSATKKATLDFVKYLLLVQMEQLVDKSVPLDIPQTLSYLAVLQQEIDDMLASAQVQTCPDRCPSGSTQVQTCDCYSSPAFDEHRRILREQFVPTAQKLDLVEVGPDTPSIGSDFFIVNSEDQSLYFYIFL